MPGRPKKPTKIKQAQGTDRKCRTLKNEMNPSKVDGVPDPPAVLKENRRAMMLWRQSVDELSHLDMLHGVDLPMLASYCIEMALYLEMTRICQDVGYVTEKGRRRGESIEAKQALDRAIKIANDFGFSPASRTKISMPDKKNEDDLFDD